MKTNRKDNKKLLKKIQERNIRKENSYKSGKIITEEKSVIAS